MRKPIQLTTIFTVDDCKEINLYSKKQSERFYSAIKERKNSKNKIVKQHSDGMIVIHHFFLHNDIWLGYVLTIGPLGGEKVYHNVIAYESNGDLFLRAK